MKVFSTYDIRHLLLYTIGIMMVAMTGCIKNDIPYPHIQANFRSLTVYDELQSSQIDSINRKVTVYLPEGADICNVKVADYTLTPQATLVGDALSEPLNLSSPVNVTLHLYYDYQWTISAVQNIERYFDFTNQIGSSTIDVPARRVMAYISDKADISKVYVERIKLGAEGSTMSPDLNGETVDFSKPVNVVVTTWGREETWTIYVEPTEATVTTLSADAWTNVAWVYGTAEAGADNGVEYRIKGDTQWTRVPESWMTYDGGSFHARIIHLSPATEYEARAVSGEDAGEVLSFVTGLELQVPNTNLDEWWLDGKVWNPWPEGGDQYWDTGNKGAATLGQSNSVPTDDTSTGTGFAAKLETKFIGIGIVGKLGAGNVFVGKYLRTDGTNGVLNMGQPFTERPTKVRGYFKYTTAPISSVSAGLEYMKGQPDTCTVWCALVDLDAPLEIRTNPKDRQLFDENASYVIAFGRMQTGENVNEYIPFEFELKYNSTSRVPKYIMLAASASKYGDYFTGGNGAVMYVDNLELVYDY